MVFERRMEAGEVVDGRFEIDSLAGSGGMAEVYRAIDRGSGRPVALKVLHRRAVPEVARFEREAALIGQLRHQHIVEYIGQGLTKDGRPYLVMEWLEGESLDDRLRRGPLSLEDTIRVARQIASALSTAHRRGVVHRDLKPSNIFVVGGAPCRVTLIDFGVAGLRDAERALTHTGVMIGSPGYMAPEQVRGEKVDPRADVFGLGCVMFRCLTGRAAYRGEVLAVLAKIVADPVPRVTEIDEGIPEPLAELVHRMMQKAPRLRPADGAAVLAELDGLGDLHRASSEERPSGLGLTRAERRVQCLLIVQLSRRTQPSVPPPRGSHDDAPTVSDEDEATAVAVPRGRETRRRLRLALARHGASADVLPEGSLLVTIGSAAHLSDQMERAARCALAVRDALGPVPMAMVAGHELTKAGAPLGHLVDRAVALLEPAQGPPAIRLDDVTAGLIDDRFLIGGDPLGLTLEAEREERDSGRTLLGRSIPCVGRQRVLSMLEGELYECISEPVARAVLITAEAGMGKTRVLREFLSSLREGGEPLAIWTTGGHPVSSGSAYAMAGGLLRRAAGVVSGESPEVSRRKLAARVARFVPERDRLRVQTFLGEMCGLAFDHDDVQLREARRDPRIMSDQIQRAWLDLCAAECRAQPLVIALEDLHLGDLPTVELMDLALRELDDQPLMVIATARPEAHARFIGLWDKRDPTEVRLPPLTPRNAAKLVRTALGDAASTTQIRRIVDRAAGNAFFLEELIRAAASGADDQLPETVLAMTQERLRRLDPEARRVLRAASIFGRGFDGDALDALLGDDLDRSQTDRWLDTLVREEVLAAEGPGLGDGGPRYGFRHAIVREAAYAMLTQADRRLGHRLAAGHLAQRGRGDPLVLAIHHERGEQWREAAACFRRAGELALEGHDLEAALRHAATANDCLEEERRREGSQPDEPDAAGAGPPPASTDRAASQGDDAAGRRTARGLLHLLEARAHQWRGDFGAVRSASEAALTLLDDASPPWLQALRAVAQAQGKLGNHDEVEEVARRLGAIADDALVDDEGYAAYLAALAVCAIELLFGGRRDRARRLLAELDERGLAATQSDIDDAPAPSPISPVVANARLPRGVADDRPAVAAAIHAAWAFDALYAGRLGDYLEQADHAMRCFEAAGDRRVATLYRINVGYALVAKGDLNRGRDALTEALRDAEAMGIARLVALAKNNLGTAELYLGHADRAERLQREAVEAYAASGNHRMEGGSRRNLAAALLERARQLARGRGDSPNRPGPSLVPLDDDEPDDSEARLTDALFGDSPPEEALLDEAEAEARRAVEILEVAPPLLAHALATLADILLTADRVEEAREAIRRALAIGGDLEDGEILLGVVQAEAAQRAGCKAEAVEAIELAMSRLMERAAGIHEAERPRFLTRVPDVLRARALHTTLTGD